MKLPLSQVLRAGSKRKSSENIDGFHTHTHIMHLTRIASFAVIISSLVFAGAQAAGLRTVAFTGDVAPGTEAGISFFDFDVPVLNDLGQTAFSSKLSGNGVSTANDRGIWSEGTGGLSKIARNGEQAPYLPQGVVIRNFAGPIIINENGHVAFTSSLSTDSWGIFAEGLGGIELIARQSDQATGLPVGVNYRPGSFLVGFAFNNTDQILFRAFLLRGNGINRTNDQGQWSGEAGNLRLVALTGNQAPDTPLGSTFRDLNRGGPGTVLNDRGQTAFFSSLSGPPFAGIWSEGSGSLANVVSASAAAPGTSDGVSFSEFSNHPVLNNSGRIAFSANLTGNDVTSTNKSGIWSDASGTISLLARYGDQAPGTPLGVNFGDLFHSRVVLNDAGQMAFVASIYGSGVDGTNGSGIWSGRTGNLGLVVREGEQAPDTAANVNFAKIEVTSLVLNAAGQTAFAADLIGSGVDSTNDRGIWATDQSGVLQLIAREGELLEVRPGVFRTISTLDFVGNTGNSDGRPSGFSNLGQLAFRARFTDNSEGIFVSNLVAVPEPSTVALMSLTSLLTLGWPVRHPSMPSSPHSQRRSARR